MLCTSVCHQQRLPARNREIRVSVLQVWANNHALPGCTLWNSSKGNVIASMCMFNVCPLLLPEHADHSSASHDDFFLLYVHIPQLCVCTCGRVCVCVCEHLCCLHKSGLLKGKAIASVPAAYNYRGSVSVRAGSMLGNCH